MAFVWHPQRQHLSNRHQDRLRLNPWISNETAFEDGGGASVDFRRLF